jgi:glutamate formiminotransferase / formiminotetrahydrofolate cyclodeaminase
MGNPIVECIPNFSEARNPEIIEKIQKAILSVPFVYILDRHSDLDHNRTVFTFIGAPQNVAEAAFQAIRCAADLIDLNIHQGEHPRIGATDVVPFIPISNITLTECVELAKVLGKRVADELNIPVYLYEEAASPEFPERKNLENVRKGQYEKLRDEISSNPERKPDYGPCQLGSAGATVIGARHPLIAFNVYLSTNEVEIAQKIAKAIRHSSGGFRYLKAIGLEVHGRAQVSMNFTNFNQTPLARVVEAIRTEAAQYGVGIHSSELVGLIPQKALTDAAKWYLQLEQLDNHQILEQRIYDVNVIDEELSTDPQQDSFLNQLADDTPVPSGEAALAYSAAQAAALLIMVAKSTLRKESYQKFHTLMEHILVEADATRMELLIAMEQDAEAYQKYLLVETFNKFSLSESQSASPELIQAIAGISHIPLLIAKKCLLLMDLALSAARYGNQNTKADAVIAFLLAKTGAHGSVINITSNINHYQDHPSIAPFLDETRDIKSKISNYQQQLDEYLQNNATD